MLVLSRKRGEKIVIGGVIEVTIIELKGDRIRIGIEAPLEVPIHRQEVFERLQNESLRQFPPVRRWSERDLVAPR
ncbi:MAG: carbon storage regulator CsrA [Pirellulales bacterium]|nr:carbon storage regulator CsrA [Pirellulales bacterium]